MLANTLFIGMGQAGNNIVDTLAGKSKMINAFFYNTAYVDMAHLKNAKVGKNIFVPNTTSGTGKNRDKSKEIMQENYTTLLSMIDRMHMINTINIISSMAGGSGGGSITTLTAMIKKFKPNITVNLILIKPALGESIRGLENSLELWNELIKIRKIINSITFVDNDKRNSKLEINEELAEDILMSWKVSNPNVNGIIDIEDLINLNNAQGCRMMLKLKEKFNDVQLAIRKAINDSIYYTSEGNICAYAGASLKDDTYDIEDIKDSINVTDVFYEGYNNFENLIFLSGMSLPKQLADDLMQELMTKRKIKETSLNVNQNDLDLIVDIGKTQEIKRKDAVVEDEPKEKENIEDIFNDDFFDNLF